MSDDLRRPAYSLRRLRNFITSIIFDALKIANQNMKNCHTKALLLACLVLMSLNTDGQKRPLSIDDLANWKFIGKVSVSNEGSWIHYEVESETGDPELYFYNVESSKTLAYPRSQDAVINHLGEWAAFQVKPGKTAVDNLRRQGTKKKDLPVDTLAILNMNDGNIEKIAGIRKKQVNDSFPDMLIFELDGFHNIPDSLKKDWKKFNDDNGYPVIIHHVANKSSDTLWYVRKWDLGKTGRHLCAQITAKDSSEQSGIVIYDLKEGETTMIYHTEGKVAQWASDRTGQHWALVLDEDSTKAYRRPYELFQWSYGSDTLKRLHDGNTSGLLPGTYLSGFYQPKFTDSGEGLILGYAFPPAQQDTNLLPEEIVDVEIWSTQDALIYPMQNKRMKGLREKSWQAIMDLKSGKLTALTKPDIDNLVLNRKVKGRYALAYGNEAYLPNITWKGHDYKDLYGVDLITGEKWRIASRVHCSPRVSPNGRYAYWFEPESIRWMCHDLAERQTYTWTNASVSRFENELNDVPAPAYPYGVAGFSEGETKVYIYDRYDIWEVQTTRDLACKKLTNGRKEQLMSRIIDLDRDKEHMDTEQLQLVRLFSEKNKQSTYGLMDLSSGDQDFPEVQPLYYGLHPIKAKNGVTFIYTKESYEAFPDIYLSSFPDIHKAEKITALNPQQSDFKWGNIQLVQWKANKAKHEGMLVLPDNFDPNRKYPLIVNFYERSSDRLYKHRRPYLHRSTMNYPYYSSRGYIIFNPDIKYTTGDPGRSALEIVESGVQHLIKQGYIDASRVALQGHSWGGYQIAYILNESSMFKCAESGAPVVNMISAYGGIRWGSGMSRMFQYERTQSRLGSTLWQDRDAYIRNSPIFTMDKMNTPLLILHNDEDGAVPWYQGIEYYMALRRLDKPAWMLNYRGEPHWPLKLENRRDFQTRMSQFFDHYMLGQPMPNWMKEGIPAYMRGIDDGLMGE